MDILYKPKPFPPPDFRAKKVLEAIHSAKSAKGVKPFGHPIEDSFCNLLLQRGPASDSVEVAYLMHQIPFSRAALNAFLMAETPTDAVIAATGVPEPVYLAYARLFFDSSVYPNRLIRLSFAEQMPFALPEDKLARDLMTWGLQLGWEYLVWKITGGRISMPASEAVHYLLTDSLWRSREHVFGTLTGARAKESRAWVPQVLKAAELMHKMDAIKVGALNNLKIHLLGEDETHSVYDIKEVEELVS